MEGAVKRNSKTPVEKEEVLCDFLCSPCSEDGLETEAKFQCINCNSNFCNSCVNLHNRILKSHTLIGKLDGQNEKRKEKLKDKASGLPSIACNEHPAEVLKMFCGKHDIVCCTVCIAIDHRLCDGIHYIPSIAKGINESQDKSDTLKLLDNTKEDLEKLITERQMELTQLDKQKDDIAYNIKDTTKRLKARIEELEKESSEQVEAEYERIKRNIRSDINSLEITLSTVQMRINKIKELESESESQVFMQIKLGQKETNKGKGQLHEIRMKKIENLAYEINSSIECYLKEIESYGYISGTVRNIRASLLGKYSIRLESEKKCDLNVYGICLIDNNEIILADNSNLKLKRLDTGYQITDWLDLGATPYGLCRTGHSEVAVSLPWLHKIQFISMGKKMVLKWSFKVDEICRSICYHDGKLYICCGGSGSEDPGNVIVSDMSGCLLRSFQTNQKRETLFTCPQNICLSDYDSNVYIADKDKGVVALNQQGHFLSVISDPRLTHTNDVCVGAHGQMFLCGYGSNNVLQFDKYRNVIQELLCEADSIVKPLTVTFLTNPPRLLITSEGSEMVKIFKLE
ncbi:uncharacterized protein LOC123549241 [Mercenaria mercenaria]|uniref:uncharacterized protein LOC123549241 n=1 Tax=Mercenaria mercenaria TaxID=6596 RepID=UPI001E1E16FC|nr:uncharacterized protein LOC123549241 [Mercenaria mercenaria]